MSRSLRGLAGVVAVLVCAGVARAQPEEQPPPTLEAPAGPPDALLAAVRDRDITLHVRDGKELFGRILGWDANTVTIARLPSNEVMTFARRDVVSVTLGGPAPPLQARPWLVSAPPPEELPPPKPRYFALEFALSPAVDLDLDVGMFHAFASASLIFPMASDGTLLAFAVGGGVSLRFRKASNWSLDIFGHLSGARFTDFGVVGFGVGLGAHHTWRNGLTLGFAAPMLGYSAQVNNPNSSSGASNVAYYYLSAVMGLPMASIGYRW